MENSPLCFLAFNIVLRLAPPGLCNLFCTQRLIFSLVALLALSVNSSSFLEPSRSPGSLPWCLSHINDALSPKLTGLLR